MSKRKTADAERVEHPWLTRPARIPQREDERADAMQWIRFYVPILHRSFRREAVDLRRLIVQVEKLAAPFKLAEDYPNRAAVMATAEKHRAQLLALALAKLGDHDRLAKLEAYQRGNRVPVTRGGVPADPPPDSARGVIRQLCDVHNLVVELVDRYLPAELSRPLPEILPSQLEAGWKVRWDEVERGYLSADRAARRELNRPAKVEADAGGGERGGVEWVTTGAVAERLCVDDSTVRRWAKVLPKSAKRKAGKAWRLDYAAVLKMHEKS